MVCNGNNNMALRVGIHWLKMGIVRVDYDSIRWSIVFWDVISAANRWSKRFLGLLNRGNYYIDCWGCHLWQGIGWKPKHMEISKRYQNLIGQVPWLVWYLIFPFTTMQHPILLGFLISFNTYNLFVLLVDGTFVAGSFRSCSLKAPPMTPAVNFFCQK